MAVPEFELVNVQKWVWLLSLCSMAVPLPNCLLQHSTYTQSNKSFSLDHILAVELDVIVTPVRGPLILLIVCRKTGSVYTNPCMQS